MIYILGPCAIESWDMYYETGKYLYGLFNKHYPDVEWYYKASFDKANRTSLKGERGIGFSKGVDCFHKIKERLPEIKLTTDVHEEWQVEDMIQCNIDLIQIPAFLCRQTDLISECAKWFPKVNIKKGQFVSPTNMCQGVDKVKQFIPKSDLVFDGTIPEAWVTERGTYFGYDRLAVDFGSVPYMKKYFDKVILDCTHSTQYTRDGFTGGNRELGKRFFKAAPIFGYDGIFAECHPNPSEAISDSDCQIKLEEIGGLIKFTQYLEEFGL